MQEENTLNSILPQQDTHLNKLLRRTKILLPFQVIVLLIVGFVFLPLLFSNDSESKGWAFLILGPYILLSIVAFAILSTLGLVNSIKLVKRKIVNGLSITVLFLSMICLIAFLIGVVTVVMPIIQSNIRYSNQQKEEKTAEQKKIDFFHERYLALQEQFKEPQIAFGYQDNSQLVINVIDNEKESGGYIPGKTKGILLGYGGPSKYYLDDQKEIERMESDQQRNDFIRRKPVVVVLPDEEIFKASYSCNGPYQDCILSYPQIMPGTEYFYANVYLGDKLLNNDFTEAEQNIAKGGLSALSNKYALYDEYLSINNFSKYPLKVLYYGVGDKVFLTFDVVNSVPSNKRVYFFDRISVILSGINPSSVIQQQKIEEFLKNNVKDRKLKIILPDFKEIESLNPNFRSGDKSSLQMNVQAYIEGENQSLNDKLKEIIK